MLLWSLLFYPLLRERCGCVVADWSHGMRLMSHKTVHPEQSVCQNLWVQGPCRQPETVATIVLSRYSRLCVELFSFADLHCPAR